MKLPHRRRFLRLAAGAAVLSAVSQMATAQMYPSRPITIIVPFPAGGGTDVTARIVSEHMSRALGQQIIIENIVGAGGTTGSTRAMRANPDGYTIEMGQMGTHATAVALYPNLAYKPDVDFVPIGLVISVPVAIVARRDFPSRDLKEFVAYVKANAEKLNIGHAGVGSIGFTCGLLFNSISGVKPTLVPFNGAGPAMNALIGGQVDYMCDGGINNSVPHVNSGTIKAYTIGSEHRSPVLPNVPTSKEAGLPDFRVSGWLALFAPKGRRNRPSTSSQTRSTRHSMTITHASGCSIWVATFRTKLSADSSRSRRSSKPRLPAGRRSSTRPTSRRNKTIP